MNFFPILQCSLLDLYHFIASTALIYAYNFMHIIPRSTFAYSRVGRRVGAVSDARYNAFLAQRSALESAKNELRQVTLTLAKWRELLKPP